MDKEPIIKEIEKGRIRSLSRIILKFIKKYIPKKLIGYYYQILHNILIICGTIVILFNNNIYHLSLCLIIVSLDAFANFVCHDCPLTRLEKKYIKNSLSHTRRNFMKNSKILYKCNHLYESQVELIVNIWTLVACKIIILLFIKTFSNKNITYLIFSSS